MISPRVSTMENSSSTISTVFIADPAGRLLAAALAPSGRAGPPAVVERGRRRRAVERLPHPQAHPVEVVVLGARVLVALPRLEHGEEARRLHAGVEVLEQDDVVREGRHAG